MEQAQEKLRQLEAEARAKRASEVDGMYGKNE